jgi:hypothetical protein
MVRGRRLEKKPEYWSGKRDLNPRPSPWQGDALPLSYSRSITIGQRGGILLMHERHCQAACSGIDKTGFVQDEPWKMTGDSLPERETFFSFLQRVCNPCALSRLCSRPARRRRINSSWSFGSVQTAPSAHLTHHGGSSRVAEGCGRSSNTSWGIRRDL